MLGFSAFAPNWWGSPSFAGILSLSYSLVMTRAVNTIYAAIVPSIAYLFRFRGA
jgi:hypothetical protein